MRRHRLKHTDAAALGTLSFSCSGSRASSQRAGISLPLYTEHQRMMHNWQPASGYHWCQARLDADEMEVADSSHQNRAYAAHNLLSDLPGKRYQGNFLQMSPKWGLRLNEFDDELHHGVDCSEAAVSTASLYQVTFYSLAFGSGAGDAPHGGLQIGLYHIL